eukprot:g2730.t1
MQRVLVTGAGRGIGQHIARLFEEKGWCVLALDLDFSACELARAERVEYDLRDIRGLARLVAELGEVHAVVNNAGVLCCPDSAAGIADPNTGLGFTASDIDNILLTNLRAPVALAEAVAPQMVARRSGRIVNVASIAGFTGHPDLWYGASKAALLNATKSLASLLARHGVQVNAVVPGPTLTPMYESLPQARKDAVMAAVNSGRPAQPVEVAEAVCWLGTDAPAYVNGATLDVNDGAYPR